jgi:hypothetical protein
MAEDVLEMTARHVRESAARIESQFERIRLLKAQHLDTSGAEQVLATLEATFELYRRHLSDLLEAGSDGSKSEEEI